MGLEEQCTSWLVFKERVSSLSCMAFSVSSALVVASVVALSALICYQRSKVSFKKFKPCILDQQEMAFDIDLIFYFLSVSVVKGAS